MLAAPSSPRNDQIEKQTLCQKSVSYERVALETNGQDIRGDIRGRRAMRAVTRRRSGTGREDMGSNDLGCAQALRE